MKRITILFLTLITVLSAFSQDVINEIVVDYPNGAITPCSPDNNPYLVQIELDISANVVTISEGSDFDSGIFDFSSAQIISGNGTISFTGNGTEITTDGTLQTIEIPLNFSTYNGFQIGQLEYSFDTPTNPTINPSNLSVELPTFDVTVSYQVQDENDPSVWIDLPWLNSLAVGEPAPLYYKNEDAVYRRITEFTNTSSNPLVSMHFNYFEEQELSLDLDQIVIQKIPSNTSSTIPQSIFESNFPINFISSGNPLLPNEMIRFTEEFSIESCSTGPSLSSIELFSCPDFKEQTLLSVWSDINVSAHNSPIDFCFDIEESADLCSENIFSALFSLSNPSAPSNAVNTGHKELGWYVLPIDLEALLDPGLELSNATIFLHLYEGSCGSAPSITIDVTGSNFVNVYDENLSFENCAFIPSDFDFKRRLAFDFSVLDNLLPINNGVLEDWFDGEYKTLMEGTGITIEFANLTVGNGPMAAIDSDGAVLNPSLLSSSLSELGCGDPGSILFQASGNNDSYYAVYRDMCEQLDFDNLNGFGLRPQLFQDNGESTPGTNTLSCPNFSSGNLNPFIHKVGETNELVYELNQDAEIYGNPLDIELEDQSGLYEVEFELQLAIPELVQIVDGMDVPVSDIDGMNPFNLYSTGGPEILGCDNFEHRAQLIIPATLWSILSFPGIEGQLGDPNDGHIWIGDNLELDESYIIDQDNCELVVFDFPIVFPNDCDGTLPCALNFISNVRMQYPAATVTIDDGNGGTINIIPCPTDLCTDTAIFEYEERTIDLKWYAVCSDCGNGEQNPKLSLGCTEFDVLFRCGECLGNTVPFNMVNAPGREFTIKRTTYGYSPLESDWTEGRAQSQLGNPIDSEGNCMDCELNKVYPGDDIEITAHGIYNNEDGDSPLAYMIQLRDREPENIELPEYIDYLNIDQASATLEVSHENGYSQTFNCDLIEKLECGNFDPNSDDLLKESIVFVFNPAEIASIPTLQNGEEAYSLILTANVERDEEFNLLLSEEEPITNLIITGNFISTNEDNNCWNEQGCDFFSATLQSLNLTISPSVLLLEPHRGTQICTRFWTFTINSIGGPDVNHFDNEFRPLFSIGSLGIDGHDNGLYRLDHLYFEASGGMLLDLGNFRHRWRSSTLPDDDWSNPETDLLVSPPDYTAYNNGVGIEYTDFNLRPQQEYHKFYKITGLGEVNSCPQFREPNLSLPYHPQHAPTIDEDAVDFHANYNLRAYDTSPDEDWNESVNNVEHLNDIDAPAQIEHTNDFNSIFFHPEKDDDLYTTQVGFNDLNSNTNPTLTTSTGVIETFEFVPLFSSGGETAIMNFWIDFHDNPNITIGNVRLLTRHNNGFVYDHNIQGHPVSDPDASNEFDDGLEYRFKLDQMPNVDPNELPWDNGSGQRPEYMITKGMIVRLIFNYEIIDCPMDASFIDIDFTMGIGCGEPSEDPLVMTNCQSCNSNIANDYPCSDEELRFVNALPFDYVREGYQGHILAILPNESFTSTVAFNEANSLCSPELDFSVSVNGEGFVMMDAEDITITLSYPSNWPLLDANNIDCNGCEFSIVNNTNPGEFSFSLDNPLSVNEVQDLTVTFPLDFNYTNGPHPIIAGVEANNICGEQIENGNQALPLWSPDETCDCSDFIIESIIMSTDFVDCETEVTIETFIEGGTAPFSYTLTSPDNSETTNSNGKFIATECGQDFTVTVVDDLGCEESITFTLECDQLDVLSFVPNSITFSHPDCTPSDGVLANNGIIGAQVENGSGDYTYTICEVNTSDCSNYTILPVSGFTIGDYQITITDNVTECSVSSEIITLVADDCCDDLVIESIAMSTDFSDCEAIVTIETLIDGGTAPFSYTLTSPDNSQTTNSNGKFIAAECGQDFTVTVVDDLGCEESITFTLECDQLDVLSFVPNSITFSHPDCTPSDGVLANNGIIGAQVENGSGDYTYTICEVNTSDCSNYTILPVSGFTIGDYQITITDNVTECSVSSEIITLVADDCCDDLVIESIAMSTDFSDCEAIVTIETLIDGGTAPFSYTLTTPDNSQTTNSNGKFIATECGQDFTVTVVDDLGCEESITFTLECDQLDVLSFVPNSITFSHPDCTPSDGVLANNGIIGAQVENGSGDYTYTICEVNTSDCSNYTILPVSGFTIGDYQITITDNVTECSVSSEIITLVADDCCDVSPITINPNFSNPTCGDPNNNWVQLNISGGTPDYTLSNLVGGVGVIMAPGSFVDIAGLACGTTYSVDITDAVGCIETVSFTTANCVNNQTPAITIVDPSCGLSNGSIVVNNVNITGFVGPGGTLNVNTIDNAPAGAYLITWVDPNTNCTGSEIAILTDNFIPITINPNFSNPACGDPDNNWVQLNISGGTPDYTLSNLVGGVGVIMAPGSFVDIAGLACGTPYSVEITDANGCMETVSFTTPNCLNNSVPIINAMDPSCGLSNGSIVVNNVNITGFVGPGGTLNVNTIDNAPAGAYLITWVDPNTNCTGSEIVTLIDSFTPIAINPNFSNPECGDPNNVWVQLNISGGTPGYTLSNLVGGVGSIPFGLPVDIAGMACGTLYSVDITDANGCMETVSFTTPNCLNNSVPIINAMDPSCGLSNGSIVVNNVNITGFVGPGGTLNVNTIDNAPAGAYLITWVDSNTNCTGSEIVTLTDNSPAVGILVTSSESNCVEATVQFELTGIAATPLISTNFAGATIDLSLFPDITISGFPCGNVIDLTINDVNGTGCVTTHQLSEISCTEDEVTFSTVDESCLGDEDGEIHLESDAQGTTEYYISSLNENDINGSFIGLASGTYTITWSNSLTECSGSLSVTINPGISCVGKDQPMCDLITNDDVINGKPNVGYGIAIAPNDSYTIVGTMYETNGDIDQYIVQRDNQDNPVYTEIEGDELNQSDDIYSDVIHLNGVEYSIGTIQSSGNHRDVVLTRSDGTANGTWTRRYDFGNEGTGDDVGTCLEAFVAPNGNTYIAIGGHSTGQGKGIMEMFIMIVNPLNGMLLGTMNNPFMAYHSDDEVNTFCYDIEYIPSQDRFLMAGSRGNQALLIRRGGFQPFVTTNDQGLLYTGPNSQFNSITTASGQLYLAGTSDGNGTNGTAALLMRLNPATLANNTVHLHHGNAESTRGNDIIAHSSGRLLLVGGVDTPTSQSSFETSSYVCQLQTNLSPIWSRLSTRFDPIMDELYAIAEANSGHLLTTGYSGSDINADNEIFVARLMPDGTGCCFDDDNVMVTQPFISSNMTFGGKGGHLIINNHVNGTTFYHEEDICPPAKKNIAFSTNDGLKSIANKVELVVIPNPNSGDFVVSLNEEKAWIENIELFDLRGNLVQSWNIEPGNYERSIPINTIDLQTGMYVIRVSTGDDKLFGKVLIE